MKINTIDGYGDTAYYTKGHVDIEQFEKKLKEMGVNIKAITPCAQVKHTLLRKTPCSNGDYRLWVLEVKNKQLQGAFKATYFNTINIKP